MRASQRLGALRLEDRPLRPRLQYPQLCLRHLRARRLRPQLALHRAPLALVVQGADAERAARNSVRPRLRRLAAKGKNSPPCARWGFGSSRSPLHPDTGEHRGACPPRRRLSQEVALRQPRVTVQLPSGGDVSSLKTMRQHGQFWDSASESSGALDGSIVVMSSLGLVAISAVFCQLNIKSQI